MVNAGNNANKPAVAIMAPPGQHYVQGTWGTWLSGGTAVPLCLSHPTRSACVLEACHACRDEVPCICCYIAANGNTDACLWAELKQ